MSKKICICQYVSHNTKHLAYILIFFNKVNAFVEYGI